MRWRTKLPRASYNCPKPYWKIARLEVPQAAAKVAGTGAGYRLKSNRCVVPALSRLSIRETPHDLQGTLRQGFH